VHHRSNQAEEGKADGAARLMDVCRRPSASDRHREIAIRGLCGSINFRKAAVDHGDGRERNRENVSASLCVRLAPDGGSRDRVWLLRFPFFCGAVRAADGARPMARAIVPSASVPERARSLSQPSSSSMKATTSRTNTSSSTSNTRRPMLRERETLNGVPGYRANRSPKFPTTKMSMSDQALVCSTPRFEAQ
jgi:hypothetical protein